MRGHRGGPGDGHTVVVVTSGAIAAGWAALRPAASSGPADPAVLQAVSAVGQHRLMRLWQDGLDPHGVAGGPGPAGPARLRAPHAVPARPGHAAPPRRARRGAGGQRERRRGRRGDPLRGQRPARRAGGAPGRRAAAGAADRRARACSPPTRGTTAEASLIEEVVEIDQQLERLAGGPGQRGRQRRHGLEAGGGQDRHLVGRARPSSPTPPGPACSAPRWPARPAWARCSGPARAASRPASCGSPSPSGPSGSLTVDEGARVGPDRPRALAARGRRGAASTGDVRARRRRRDRRARRRRSSPRAWSGCPRRTAAEWMGRRSQVVVHRDDLVLVT